MTEQERPQTRLPSEEEEEALRRWVRRQRMLSPIRSVLHRLRGHEVGRYACFTCDMDLLR